MYMKFKTLKCLLLMIAIAAMTGLTGCENSKIRQLKAEIARENRSLPQRLPTGTGSMDSIAYNDDENMVEYYYTLTNELSMPKQISGHKEYIKYMVSSATGKNRDMFKEVANMGISISYNYSNPAWNGETASVVLSAKEIDEALYSDRSDFERAEEALQALLQDYKSMEGQQLDEITIFSEAKLEGNDFVVIYQLEEGPEYQPNYDEIIALHNAGDDSALTELLKEIISSPSAIVDRTILVESNRGFTAIYNIPAGTPGEYCPISVSLSPYELREMGISHL